MAGLRAIAVLLHLLCSWQAARAGDDPTAVLPTGWLSTPRTEKPIYLNGGSQVRSLLLRHSRTGSEAAYACGFYCGSAACDSFLFAVFIQTGSAQVVWAANRGHPVGENATLQLGSDGDLVLADADGTKVWSSGTSGKPVAGINLTEQGNLVLFGGDSKNNQNQNQSIWWESFAHPTDSLLPGQKLRVGQNLTANDSATNSTEGLYYLSATSTAELVGFIKSEPPTRYSSFRPQSTDVGKEVDYFVFANGSISTSSPSGQYYSMPPLQFLRLESDGHLRAYDWRPDDDTWVVVNDLLTPAYASPTCFYPTVCGRYGMCYVNEQCSCPQWDGDGANHNYLVPVDSQNPMLGCREAIPLSCGSPRRSHRLLRLDNVSYFIYDQRAQFDSLRMDQDGCSNTCARNCSCKAAFFWYSHNISDGFCYLASEVFSLKNFQHGVYYDYNATAFIKVQDPPGNSRRKAGVILFLGSALGALFLLCVCSCILVLKRKIWRQREKGDGEDDLERVSGMPKRFSIDELGTATDGFCKKLGQGGFGSVYEGRIDGKAVAVKRLDGASQGRKEFLAEVETLGKIHHVNLVKLIGYCAEQSHRLLVYEFMPNGSLDRWIFHAARRAPLDWQTRCKIILGVAKGISYLHQDCSQKIAHLDIKPQNILLDDRFQAKVSDFGLAKLMDRDLTHVETRMRGTPGYLAPEWLTSRITEKVDVYSFGVVILEIICGRRNLYRSRQEEEGTSLVTMLKRKVEDGEQLDLLDESIKNAYFHFEEAMKMFKIAMWCLQDENRRPPMSTVVKVLEGATDVESNLEDLFLASPVVECNGALPSSSAPLLASVLSGPR